MDKDRAKTSLIDVKNKAQGLISFILTFTLAFLPKSNSLYVYILNLNTVNLLQRKIFLREGH